MGNGNKQLHLWWCSAFACALLSFVAADGSPVNITYVETAVAKGAVCLDGSPPAYYLDRGFGSGVNSWLVHFQGGAWCNNVTNCLQRSMTTLGSSKSMAKQVNFTGILSNTPDYNPARPIQSWTRQPPHSYASYPKQAEKVTGCQAALYCTGEAWRKTWTRTGDLEYYC